MLGTAHSVPTSSGRQSTQSHCGAAGGKGAWAAVDPIGGDIAGKITACLRDDGELIVFGAMSVVTSNVGIRDIMFRGVKVAGCHHSKFDFCPTVVCVRPAHWAAFTTACSTHAAQSRWSGREGI